MKHRHLLFSFLLVISISAVLAGKNLYSANVKPTPTLLPGPMGADALGCYDEDGDGFYLGEGNPSTSPCRERLKYRGLEKAICDCPDLEVGKLCKETLLTKDHLLPLFDSEKVYRRVYGRQFHPGTPDAAGNGFDEDCDGQDMPTACCK